MNVKIFQFNGCNKCFNETLLLKKENNFNVELILEPKNWKEEKVDVAVITGYLLPTDKDILVKIQNNSTRILAYGNCATTGGVFALANQKGYEVTPLRKLIEVYTDINGCLGEIEELKTIIEGQTPSRLKALCGVCARKSTCQYLDEVHRQIELDDNETCFNDLGYLCNGYIAIECKERCIDYDTPCRGCKPMIERSGIRMLGMFGTLMGNIEVATEHSVKGATDKLADDDDDVTESLPDIVGNFFRFTLPTSGLPRGRNPPNGSLIEDVFTGRLIEELPLITGLMGGTKSISMTLKIIEAYEKGAKIEISDQTKKYRDELLRLEKELQVAIADEDSNKYNNVCKKIRKIAGNMNLSNVFFGGFKAPINEENNFEEYKTHIFDVVEGTYENDSIKYHINSKGIITEMKIKEGFL
ncbi:MAG: hypothetical protein ACFFAH_02545 [Promethearchaeota archaeon]